MATSASGRALLGATLAVSAFAAPRAAACSVCRCGDPTYSMVGSQVFMPGRFRLAFDADRFSKDQVAESHDGPGELGLREEEVEQRYTLSLGYTAGRRLTLLARVPLAQRTITVGDERESLSGLGDPELVAHYRIASAKQPGTWIALTAGVVTGWGQNDMRLEGERAEEHLQPGTGATGATAGVGFSKMLGSGVEVFGSAGGRFNGRNDHGYRYGHVFLANVAAERQLASRLNGVVELNFRAAARDEEEPGHADENSGGSVLYVSPRLLLKLDPAQNLWFRLGVQVPIVKDLYGDQDEKVNVLAGLTVRF